MSRLLNSVSYPRCPICACLLVEAWEVEHAPHCTFTRQEESNR